MSLSFRKSAAKVFAFIVIGCASATALSAPQTPPSAPVTVVNTATNPVPVTAPQALPISGSITVTGTSNVNVTNASIPVTGSVNASQSGTWNVGITGTPTVAISGPVTTIPGVDPADAAVQFVLPLEPNFCGSSNAYYAVPSGHRLVIEFVSASAISFADNPDATFALRINTSLGASAAFQVLPMPKQRVENGGHPFAAFANAVPMRAYSDADSKVCATLEYLFSGPIPGISVAVSGHLVPQP